MSAFGIIFWTLVVILIACIVNWRQRIKKTENYLLGSEGFSLTKKFVNSDGRLGLAFDDNSKKLCFVENEKNVPLVRIVSYKDLISSEIFQDGETITSSVRSGDLTNAAIGGLIFGGSGAIVGSLASKTKFSNTEMVNKISLRLTVNDTKNPLFEIDFLDSQTTKKGAFFQNAMKEARHWHGLIEVLIKQADMEDKENVKNNVAQISSNSLADELKKLAELHDSGVLSNTEFQQQKEKLLG